MRKRIKGLKIVRDDNMIECGSYFVSEWEKVEKSNASL